MEFDILKNMFNQRVTISQSNNKEMKQPEVESKAQQNQQLTWSSKSGLVRLIDRFLINNSTCIGAKVTFKLQKVFMWECLLRI